MNYVLHHLSDAPRSWRVKPTSSLSEKWPMSEEKRTEPIMEKRRGNHRQMFGSFFRKEQKRKVDIVETVIGDPPAEREETLLFRMFAPTYWIIYSSTSFFFFHKIFHMTFAGGCISVRTYPVSLSFVVVGGLVVTERLLNPLRSSDVHAYERLHMCADASPKGKVEAPLVPRLL